MNKSIAMHCLGESIRGKSVRRVRERGERERNVYNREREFEKELKMREGVREQKKV